EAALESSLLGASAQGELVGVWTAADGSRRDFAWLPRGADGKPGGYNDLGPHVHAYFFDEPGDRNAAREWARSTYYTANRVSHALPHAALVRANGVEIRLGTLPGGEAAVSRGVTDARDVVGWSTRPGADGFGNPLVSG